MKKIISILIFLYFSLSVNAQLELKFNPIALIFESGQFGIEQVLSDYWGIDADLFITSNILYATVSGKHYLNPKIKADGFHIGVFTGLFYADNDDGGIGVGFLGGYKVLSKKGVIFELGLGLGRAAGIENIVPYFRFNVGYRFGRDKGEL